MAMTTLSGAPDFAPIASGYVAAGMGKVGVSTCNHLVLPHVGHDNRFTACQFT
nr:hypothetical protein [Spirosoma endbachense]